MARTTLLFLLLLGLSTPLRAQSDLPNLGDRVRLQSVDGETLAGEFLGLAEGTVSLMDPEGVVRTMDLAELEAWELGVEGEKKMGRFISVTMLATSVVGATLAATSWEPPEPCYGAFFCDEGPDNRGTAAAKGFVSGALLGLVAGLALGALAPPGEAWVPLPLPGESGMRLSVEPAAGGELGITFRLPWQ